MHARWELAQSQRSILLRQHNRNHALGDRRIRWVWRVITTRVIKIIDLKEYCLTIDLERPKVMFAVRVVGVAELVINGNCLDDALTVSAPSAATPAVITAVPVAKF
jgi:hypothetical protein